MSEFINVQDFFKQAVHEFSDIKLFELATPGYTALKKATDKKPITEKGYQIPMWVRKPGGHTFFTPNSSSFNRAVAPQSRSMFVFPIGYAFPIRLQGPLVRALRAGGGDAIINSRQYIKLHVDTAMKRIEQMHYGRGDGALAYSATNLTAPGSGQTLTCTTTAATTPGQTKGAKWLDEGHYYQGINATNSTVRGTVLVETAGTSSCVVNLINGTISSGDPLVDVGAYMKVMRGLGHLISDQNRTLQGLNSALYTDLNSPFVDMNGALETPATIETGKAQIRTRANNVTADNGLIAFTTGGRLSNLRKQGYGFRKYDGGDDTVRGISKRYVDGDTSWVEAADMDEDRYYFVKPEAVLMFEEMPFGDYDLDGLEMRMLVGDNQNGSDEYSKAVGTRSNAGITAARGCMGIKRCSTTGITTQVSS